MWAKPDNEDKQGSSFVALHLGTVPGSRSPVPDIFPAHLSASYMSGPVDVKHVPKPWGHETIWALTDRYCGKVLHINAGQALSVQYHNQKDETVHLLTGRLVYWVNVDGALRDMQLEPGQSFRITPGTVHYMEAITDCDVLEVSTPELDDVVRIQDRYGREGTSAP